MKIKGNRDLLTKFSDPFQGFNLQFIEIEILRTIYYYKLDEISQLYNFIIENYKNVKLSKSQFYRVIEKLDKNKYIKNVAKGKEKKLELTLNGEKELYLFLKYIFSIMRDQIFTEDAMIEIYNILNKLHTKCLRTKSILHFGPYPVNIPQIQEMCLECDNPENISDEELEKSLFISLPNTKATAAGLDNNLFQTLEHKDPYDMLLKNESFDIVIENITVYRYGIRTLDEIHRIMKPGGWLLMFEPTNNLSMLIVQIINQILLGKSIDLMDWVIDPTKKPLLKKNEFKKEIEKKFTNIQIKSDMVLTLYLAQKPL